MEHHRHRRRRDRQRGLVPPGDPVRIEDQLAIPGLAVVEDGHSLRSDDDELLLLEGVQPRDEYVRALAARESQVRGRDIRDRRVKMVAPDGADAVGLRADQGQDHGEVVRREGPEDVLLAPDSAEVEPIGIDVLNEPQPALPEQRSQRQEGRMVLHEMAHHQPPIEPLRQHAQLFGLVQMKRERLFHEHVLARLEGPLGERVVERRRGGDRDGIDGGIGKHGLQARSAEPMPGKLRLDRFSIGIDQGRENTQLGEIADEVLSPVTAADDGNARRSCRRQIGRSRRSMLRSG